MGNNAGHFKKGQKPWCAGMKMDSVYRKKLSEAHLGQIPWNLGKTYISEKARAVSDCISRFGFRYKEWRLKVLERDNFTCLECECNDKSRLQAHHIIEWDDNVKVRFDVDNGKTLCTTCHRKIHGFQKGSGYWTGKKRSLETIEKMRKARAGIPLTEEHKQKIRDALKMNPPNSGSFKNGQEAWNKGKSPSLESRKKMSVAQRKRFKLHPVWNKGLKMGDIA